MHDATDRPTTGHAEVAGPRADVRRLTPVALVALVVLAADQATKVAIRSWLAVGESWPSGEPLLALSRVENSGAAFGILQGAGTFLVIVTAVGLVAMLAFALFTPLGRWYGVALGAILGGALGNFIDRISRGTVTDFVDPRWYPSFNVADSAIVCGVVALIAFSFLDPAFEGESRRPEE